MRCVTRPDFMRTPYTLALHGAVSHKSGAGLPKGLPQNRARVTYDRNDSLPAFFALARRLQRYMVCGNAALHVEG